MLEPYDISSSKYGLAHQPIEDGHYASDSKMLSGTLTD